MLHLLISLQSSEGPVCEMVRSLVATHGPAIVSIPGRTHSQLLRWWMLLAAVDTMKPVNSTDAQQSCCAMHLTTVLASAVPATNLKAVAELMSRPPVMTSPALQQAVQASMPALVQLLHIGSDATKRCPDTAATRIHAARLVGAQYGDHSLAAAYAGGQLPEDEVSPAPPPPPPEVNLFSSQAPANAGPDPQPQVQVVTTMEGFQQEAARLLQLEEEMGRHASKSSHTSQLLHRGESVTAPATISSTGLVLTPTTTRNLAVVREALTSTGAAPLLLEGSTGGSVLYH
jgi:hypothetical protein